MRYVVAYLAFGGERIYRKFSSKFVDRMAAHRKKQDPYYLVPDTNFFLYQQNNRNNAYGNRRLEDRRSAVDILKSFQDNGQFGTLGPVVVRIPYMVRLELAGLGTGPYTGFILEGSVPFEARRALDFMDEVPFDDPVITFQTSQEHRAMRKLGNFDVDDNDEIILLVCMEARELYSRNVILITNDVNLSARAIASGIRTMTMMQLKYALLLRNGANCNSGSTYWDGERLGRKYLDLKRWAERPERCDLGTPSLTNEQERTNSGKSVPLDGKEPPNGPIREAHAKNRNSWVDLLLRPVAWMVALLKKI